MNKMFVGIHNATSTANDKQWWILTKAEDG